MKKGQTLHAYWDKGSGDKACGPDGDDHNSEWCNKPNGGPCKKEVNTPKCPSGIAKLTSVKGNQYATGYADNYRDPKTGCYYTYFATYTCTGNPLLCKNPCI